MRATVILNLLITRISRETNVDLKRRDPTSAVRLAQNHAFPERAPNILPRGLEIHLTGTHHGRTLYANKMFPRRHECEWCIFCRSEANPTGPRGTGHRDREAAGGNQRAAVRGPASGQGTSLPQWRAQTRLRDHAI
jgi:hypothetical protein